MHIIEKSKINRAASKVWPFIVSPEHFQLWNTKVVSMDATGQFVLNQPFTTRYRMSGKEMQCYSMVTALEHERLLEMRHSNCIGNGINSELVVSERITLEDTGQQTIVINDVDIKHHKIPWILIPLIWFIMRFGRSAKPDKLKIMCKANP